jgi:phosphomannomutase
MAEAAQAEALVAQFNEDEAGSVDPSHDLDMVTIAEVQGTTGEMEAMAIQSILDANGISAVLVGSSTLPVLSFTVQVPKADVERAQAALAEARAAGPAAAAEGALESEKSG